MLEKDYIVMKTTSCCDWRKDRPSREMGTAILSLKTCGTSICRLTQIHDVRSSLAHLYSLQSTLGTALGSCADGTRIPAALCAFGTWLTHAGTRLRSAAR